MELNLKLEQILPLALSCTHPHSDLQEGNNAALAMQVES